MKGLRLKNKISKISILVPLVVFLISWELYANLTERGVFFFGSPSSVAKYLYLKTLDGSIWWDTAITLYEVIIGFIIGNILGSILGLLFWYNEKVSKIIKPYILIAGSIPIIAFAPIIVNKFGIGIWSKIVIVIFSTIVVATVQAFEGASQTDRRYISYLTSLGANRWQIFKKVVLPSSMIWLFAGFKLNIGFAILGAFLGEFISAQAGLGHLIMEAMGLFNTPLVLAGVVMISLLAIVLNVLISALQRYILPWEYSKSEVKTRNNEK